MTFKKSKIILNIKNSIIAIKDEIFVLDMNFIRLVYDRIC